MEDYKKKYENALEKARVWKEKSGMPIDKQGILDDIFPELKESEDEKIRKELIRAFTVTADKRSHEIYGNGITYGQVLAWLEKQSEQKSQGKSVLEVWKDMRFEVYQQASGNRNEANHSDDSTKMFSLTDIDEIFEKVAEKQGEQKPADKCIGCNNFKGCITCTDGDQYTHITEQSSTEEVEPKFKADDWITNSIETVQITGYDIDYGYQVDYEGNLQHRDTDIIEKEYHLWTIQDAKEGDVLCNCCKEYSNPLIFILNKFERVNFGLATPSDYSSYCFLTAGDRQKFKEGAYHHKYDIKPATKEQRDLLFQKMKEAGYEWDAEKKELKKIKQTYFQKQEWTGYDEKAYEIALLDIDKSPSITKNDSIDWLKSLKNRVQPQPKQEWSEEDENMLQKAISAIMYALSIPIGKENDPCFAGSSTISWFKSLKERYTWKPSDEQMTTFWDAICNLNQDGYKWITDMKSLYQDLKKLKEG